MDKLKILEFFSDINVLSIKINLPLQRKFK